MELLDIDNLYGPTGNSPKTPSPKAPSKKPAAAKR
jgi:hypothetical protein